MDISARNMAIITPKTVATTPDPNPGPTYAKTCNGMHSVNNIVHMILIIIIPLSLFQIKVKYLLPDHELNNETNSESQHNLYRLFQYIPR